MTKYTYLLKDTTWYLVTVEAETEEEAEELVYEVDTEGHIVYDGDRDAELQSYE